jgi:hypothetical protein
MLSLYMYQQKASLAQLSSDYQFVYDSIISCCRDDDKDVVVPRSEKDRQVMSLITALEDRRVTQVSKPRSVVSQVRVNSCRLIRQEQIVLKPMETLCAQTMEAKLDIAQSKYNLTK